MTKLERIIKEKTDRLSSVPDALVSASSRSQESMYKDIEDLLSKMDVVDGKFVFNEKNMALIEEIGSKLSKDIFSDSYITSLTNYAKEFNSQGKINDAYFSELLGDFETTSLYKSVVATSQKNAITLLSDDAVTAQIISPIKNTILSGVTNAGSFKDTLKTLRDFTTNTDGTDGALTRYVKRVAYDSFAVGDRQYTKAISEGLGLEFYFYQGGDVADTRCFCEERFGGFYHKKEIQGWGNGKGVGACGYPWQGMNAKTNEDTIFSFVGGYNCKHSLLPYITSEVPKKWINRAIEKGFYTK